MTVICPSCDARFRDPPEDVPETRALQCSKCEHEWMPATAKTSKPLLQITPPAMAPDMDDLRANGPNIIRTGLPVIIETFANKPADEDTEEFEPRYFERDPVAPPKKKPVFAMAMCAFAVLTATSLGIHFRAAVSEQFPQTAAVYHTLGLSVKQQDLMIENVVTSRTRKDGIRQLIVRGEIENIASNTVPVPPLKLIMRDNKNADLYAWTVTAAKSKLKSGERSRFTAVAQDYPKGADKVEVEFTDPIVTKKK